jgi:hypothetical protein
LTAVVVVLGILAIAALALGASSGSSFFSGNTPAPAPPDGSAPGDATAALDYSSAPPVDQISTLGDGDVAGPILGGTGMQIPLSKVTQLATAIATAEGFFSSDPNVVPRRANNPIDLTDGLGVPTLGNANKEGVKIFGSIADGWKAAYIQVTAMLDGSSKHYTVGMSIFQVAKVFTGNDNPAAWANNCASVLGLSTSNTLQDFLNL